MCGTLAHWHADFGKTHAVLDFKHWQLTSYECSFLYYIDTLNVGQGMLAPNVTINQTTDISQFELVDGLL